MIDQRSFRIGWNKRRFSIALPATESLVAKEEKGLISADRTTDRTAEIVVTQCRNGDAALVVKPIVGVQFLIAEELIKAAMKLVRGRARGGPQRSHW